MLRRRKLVGMKSPMRRRLARQPRPTSSQSPCAPPLSSPQPLFTLQHRNQAIDSSSQMSLGSLTMRSRRQTATAVTTLLVQPVELQAKDQAAPRSRERVRTARKRTGSKLPLLASLEQTPWCCILLIRVSALVQPGVWTGDTPS
jgi:hypothetical protein